MTTEPPPPSTPPLKPAPPPPVPKHNPETLFRSETMHLYQIIVRNEAAYDCVAELGKVGAVQFRDVIFLRLMCHECSNFFPRLCAVESRRDDVPTQIR